MTHLDKQIEPKEEDEGRVDLISVHSVSSDQNNNLNHNHESDIPVRLALGHPSFLFFYKSTIAMCLFFVICLPSLYAAFMAGSLGLTARYGMNSWQLILFITILVIIQTIIFIWMATFFTLIVPPKRMHPFGLVLCTFCVALIPTVIVTTSAYDKHHRLNEETLRDIDVGDLKIIKDYPDQVWRVTDCHYGLDNYGYYMVYPPNRYFAVPVFNQSSVTLTNREVSFWWIGITPDGPNNIFRNMLCQGLLWRPSSYNDEIGVREAKKGVSNVIYTDQTPMMSQRDLLEEQKSAKSLYSSRLLMWAIMYAIFVMVSVSNFVAVNFFKFQ